MMHYIVKKDQLRICRELKGACIESVESTKETKKQTFNYRRLNRWLPEGEVVEDG